MSATTVQHSAWEEGVAIGLLRELADPEPPIDAIGIAELCGLQVIYTHDARARIVGETVYVPSRGSVQEQHERVIHEVGHWALKRAAVPDGEASATYVGDAIALERRSFDTDLRTSAWDFRVLRAKHMLCTSEMLARRIVTMRDACVSIWEGRRMVERLASPWLPEPLHRVSKFERDLARTALERGDTVRADELLWAFPGTGGRVITVCEAEQLGLRY